MPEPQPSTAPTTATITINGVELTGTLRPLGTRRALFLANAESAAEVYVGGPMEIFETKGGEESHAPNVCKHAAQ